MNSDQATPASPQSFRYWAQKFDWPVVLFILITQVLAIILTPIYFYNNGVQWGLVLFALIFAGLTNLAITAGYHRLFSHKSYDAHPIAKAIFLLIGSSAWQGSALKWSSDHRRHHAHIDGDKDPYNINEGFWFAHTGWLFRKSSISLQIQAPDLEKDWMIRFQHKFFIPLGLIVGFGLPTLIGWMMGSAWGGFLIGGILRVVLTQQSTFFVNSLCHTLGRQTYCTQISARDSLFVAFLTHGEGYHNFHHKFQIDYRNGIRWYQWDPTKWVIITLKRLGLAYKLRQVPQVEILKARLQIESVKLVKHGLTEDIIASTKEKILSAQEKIKALKEDYANLKLDYAKKRDELRDHYEHRVEELKREIAIAKTELQMGLKQWKAHLRSL